MRYQTCQDRAYQRATSELAKHRAERRKAEIGFESKKRQEAEELRRARQEQRRDAKENRDRDLHKVKIARAEIKLEREIVRTKHAAAAAAASETAVEPPELERIAACTPPGIPPAAPPAPGLRPDCLSCPTKG